MADTATATRALTRPSVGYVPEVDSLRWLAVSLVIVYHAGLLPFGWSGVWVFFVISGFAVTTSLSASAARREPSGTVLRHFYIRRCLRIWPLYYTFLAVNVVVLLELGRDGPLDLVPWLASFTYNMALALARFAPRFDWAPFGPLWTLAVEEQFYLLYPLLFLALPRGRLVFALALIVIAAPLIRWGVGDILLSWRWTSEQVALGIYTFAPAHFDAFAAGCLLALYRRDISGQVWLVRSAAALVLAAGFLYAAYYSGLQWERQGHVSAAVLRNIFSGILWGDRREVALYTIVWASGATLLLAVLAGHGAALRLCRLPGLQAMGRISFGAYIFNAPVYALFDFFFPALAPQGGGIVFAAATVRLAVSYGVTMAAAAVSFRYLEQPVSRLRMRFA